MKNGSQEEFMVKSKENLKSAELLFENGLYNASANRAYYAAFHAAIAVLAKVDIETDRISHKAVQTNFSVELIQKRKIFPARLKSYLSELQEKRNIADYRQLSISKKIASVQFEKAKEFVIQLVKKEIKNV